jgi:hypothetical protein
MNWERRTNLIRCPVCRDPIEPENLMRHLMFTGGFVRGKHSLMPLANSVWKTSRILFFGILFISTGISYLIVSQLEKWVP